MVPPATATAPARQSRSAAAPAKAPGREPARRAPLRVVPARHQAGGNRPAAAQNRLVVFLAVAVIVAALLVVVIGQAMLASGQVRMTSLQHQLMLEQASHREAVLQDSALETPSRIVQVATSAGLVHEPSVTELPYVSLTVPLPTPKVTPTPAATVTPSTTTSASTTPTTVASTP